MQLINVSSYLLLPTLLQSNFGFLLFWSLKDLSKANEKNPNDADTLNYLGFALRKLGNFEEAEKYYLEGLVIKPDHVGINEYLGELYIITNRIELAKQNLRCLRLVIVKNMTS